MLRRLPAAAAARRQAAYTTKSSPQYTAPLGVKLSPSRQRLIPTSGTYPRGFEANAVTVGIKASNKTRPDMALLASRAPCAAAAVFTKNKFQAAPVLYSKNVLTRAGNLGVHGIVINSGCANAVTGKGGRDDAIATGAAMDAMLQGPGSTLVMSTGVIGQRLPMDKILGGIRPLALGVGDSHEKWLQCASAICTTDTFPKLLSREFTLPSAPGTTYRIAGMTKGAGMIHPNMATLLGVIATDARVAPAAIQPLLRHAVDRSFNCITIDGDTSTNDTIALLANGAAAPEGAEPVSDRGDPVDYVAFRDVLTTFARDLAQLVVRDGEGATKFVTVRVLDAASESAARRIASTISRSPLVKTALYGKDANWGRILCATGYALVSEPGDEPGEVSALAPDRTSVSFVPSDGSAELRLLDKGEPVPLDEARASEVLDLEDVEIVVRLGTGKEQATYWTCDYSHEYITINGDYRT